MYKCNINNYSIWLFQVDSMVCIVNSGSNLATSPRTSKLLKSAGSCLQTVYTELLGSLQQGEVKGTGGHDLPIKNVLFSRLPPYKDIQDAYHVNSYRFHVDNNAPTIMIIECWIVGMLALNEIQNKRKAGTFLLLHNKNLFVYTHVFFNFNGIYFNTMYNYIYMYVFVIYCKHFGLTPNANFAGCQGCSFRLY